MPFKDILVHVDSSSRAKARVELALSLAARSGAHLTGLYVMPPATLSPLLADQYPPKLLEDADARLGKARDDAEALFAAAVSGRGIAAEWLESEGDAVELVTRAARQADLTVIGQALPDEEVIGVSAEFPEAVAIGAGRAVLAVPYAGNFPTLGERVLIAWNDSPQAARAVGDALPLLRKAASVEVLTILAAGEEGEEITASAAGVARHLERHGVKAKAHHLVADHISVADMLLSRAADEGADLLVMGVYGHSRLRELVLGGVSREIFAHMTLPVLMAH